MRKALWRIACALAAACGIAFGLWAGAGIARGAEPAAHGVICDGGDVTPECQAATSMAPHAQRSVGRQ
jgi:hypothetical protein